MANYKTYKAIIAIEEQQRISELIGAIAQIKMDYDDLMDFIIETQLQGWTLMQCEDFLASIEEEDENDLHYIFWIEDENADELELYSCDVFMHEAVEDLRIRLAAAEKVNEELKRLTDWMKPYTQHVDDDEEGMF